MLGPSIGGLASGRCVVNGVGWYIISDFALARYSLIKFFLCRVVIEVCCFVLEVGIRALFV